VAALTHKVSCHGRRGWDVVVAVMDAYDLAEGVFVEVLRLEAVSA
jgi:hypothetical protein